MRTARVLTAALIIIAIFTLGTGKISARVRPIILPPPAPLGLKTVNVTDSEVILGWIPVYGALRYKIYMAEDSYSNYTEIGTTSTPAYKITGLKSSTSYKYYVKAYNGRGVSGSSNIIAVNTAAASSKIVLGYTTYYYPGDLSSYNSIVSSSDIINGIATHTFITDGQGNISGIIPSEQLTYANSSGIMALAGVNNNFDGNTAKILLESYVNRQNLINNILSALKAHNYKGVNIDLEGVFYYDRGYLTEFMKELYNSLNPQGYMVYIAVPAKVLDNPAAPWNGAFDYAQLANYADRLVIMTYDEHYPDGTPGPIASAGWVQNVANYASTVIPKEKILLGIAAYGYDWSSKGTKAYSINGVNSLAAKYGAQVQWDPVSKSPYFSYKDAGGVYHTVWFENGTSIGYKLDIVKNTGLAGIAIWRLGLENADYWTSIRTKLMR